MSPQRKGTPRPADAERIGKAVELRALAEYELAAAVINAMRHGSSIRETALASGLSESTIIRWRRGQGLPTLDDWHGGSREARERLYEAYPWLREHYDRLARRRHGATSTLIFTQWPGVTTSRRRLIPPD